MLTQQFPSHLNTRGDAERHRETPFDVPRKHGRVIYSIGSHPEPTANSSIILTAGIVQRPCRSQKRTFRGWRALGQSAVKFNSCLPIHDIPCVGQGDETVHALRNKRNR